MALHEYETRRAAQARWEARVRRLADERGLSYEEVAADLRRRIAARRKAARLGLAYWPALMADTGVDPRCFVIAEEILRGDGPVWGTPLPDGSRSHGGWDWYGHWGASPWDVAKAWLAAGCKPSRKFRVAVATLRGGRDSKALSPKKWETAQGYIYRLRGWRWALRTGVLAHGRRLSDQALRALGQLPWYCRWAAVYGLPDALEVVRLRDLNWAAVKVAQKGMRAAVRYMPPVVRTKVLWVTMLARPTLLGYLALSWVWEQLPDPLQVKMSALRALIDADEVADLASLVPAARLVTLFGGDLAAIRRFAAGRSIHDAGQFTLPRESGWNRRAWAALVLRHPDAATYLGLAVEIELQLGRVPSDLAELRQVVTALPARCGAWASLAGLSTSEEEDYRRLFEGQMKSFIGVPAVVAAQGGYVLRQLAHDDPLQALAGRLVNCCQHLHGAAASCARAAWQQGDAAIWAVFRDDRMVAQAFVWRSTKDDIVLDSVECLRGHEDAVAPLFVAAAKQAVGRLSVRRVAVGGCGFGATSETRRYSLYRTDAPKPTFSMSYTDVGDSVYVLAEATLPDRDKKASKMVKKATKEASAAAPTGAENRLLEGSGVFCEYCDAEVHPDCEICPICGENIAEWVD